MVVGRALGEAMGVVLLTALPAAVSYPGAAEAIRHADAAVRATSTATKVSLKQALSWPKDQVLWLDAREASAYEQSHIPGAMRLSGADWDEELFPVLEAWRPGMKVVVYCDSEACGASEAVARRLADEARIPSVYVLDGGWTTWLKHNHHP